MTQQTEHQQNEQALRQRYDRMTTAPVGPLILSLAVPSMVTTLITSVYNLADTFFVGQIGTSATAAVGVVFSIPMVLSALGFWVGTGSSSLVSGYLGAQKQREADEMTSTAFVLSFLFGAAVCAAGLLGGAPLLRLLGATETILPYAQTYSRYILLAGPFAASSLALGQGLRAEGLSRESMIGQVTGGVLNMLLDPLFIFVFDWGIRGAALATALSQLVSWWLLLRYYVQGKTQVRLSVRLVARAPRVYARLFGIGFPSLCRHGCNMLSNVVLNTVAGGWGDAAIAAMSIAGRMTYLSSAVFNGLNQGSQPVIGYAHGKGDQGRVQKAFWFAVRFSMLSMCGFAAAGLAFAPWLIGVFRDDPEVVRIGARALRWICLALPFAAFMGSASTLFQVVGRPVPSSVLIFSRQLVFYIPALLALPRVLDLTGLVLAGPLADLLAFGLALPLVLRYFRAVSAQAPGL